MSRTGPHGPSPDVSVVIPLYNSSSLVRACLTRLCSQTLAPERFEVIVADDCSTDGSADAVEAMAPGLPFRLTLVRRSENGGPGAARNSGIEAARAPVIALLDADTEPQPEWLEEGLAALEGFDAVEGFTEIGDPERITPFTHQTENTSGGTFPTCNMFVRRSVFERIGGFDPRFYDRRARVHYREDTDFALRMLEHGMRLGFAEKAKVIHRPLSPGWKRPLQLARRYRHDRLLRRKHPGTFHRWTDVYTICGRRFGRLRQKLYWSYLAGLAALLVAAVSGLPVWIPGAWSLLCLGGIWWLHVRRMGRRAFTSLSSLAVVPVCAVVPLVYAASVVRGVFLHPGGEGPQRK